AGAVCDSRTVERRSADGGLDDAAARSFWGDLVRVSAAGYAAMPDVRDGADVDDGVWVGGECEGLSVHFEVLAVSECEGGDEVSGDLLLHGRWGYAGGSDECAEDDSVDADVYFEPAADSA